MEIHLQTTDHVVAVEKVAEQQNCVAAILLKILAIWYAQYF